MIRRSFAAILMICLAFGSSAETPPDSERLAEIFSEDQAARQAAPIDWEAVWVMDAQHRKEVLGMLSAGKIRTSNDFYRAAMLMQNGETTGEYQLAFSLSRISATLDPSNRNALWLSAASWDRILMSKGVPQWYGTQYRTPSPGAPTELYRIDESIVTDAERAATNVPPLQEAKDLLLEINR